MLNFKKFVKSFKYAFQGLKHVFRTEQNFQVQILFAVAILILSAYFKIKSWQFVALIIIILVVLVLELLNSIFERLVDILEPKAHFYVKTIKDIMAATVLLASLAALTIGLIIFWPYIFKI